MTGYADHFRRGSISRLLPTPIPFTTLISSGARTTEPRGRAPGSSPSNPSPHIKHPRRITLPHSTLYSSQNVTFIDFHLLKTLPHPIYITYALFSAAMDYLRLFFHKLCHYTKRFNFTTEISHHLYFRPPTGTARWWSLRLNV